MNTSAENGRRGNARREVTEVALLNEGAALGTVKAALGRTDGILIPGSHGRYAYGRQPQESVANYHRRIASGGSKTSVSKVEPDTQSKPSLFGRIRNLFRREKKAA